MMAYSGGDPVSAIVADVGQYSTKMGFAGEDCPRSYFRSNVAVLREELKVEEDQVVEGGSTKRQRRRPIAKVKYDYYTRPICFSEDNDGSWEVANPVDRTTGLWYDNTGPAGEDGGGADWHDLLQHLLQHGFESALGSTPSNHPLLLVERSYTPPPIRQQVLECLMEELNVPAAFLARDATMACYATGRTTGTVVDIGHGGTVVTPVYEGYVEQKGIRRSLVGGLAMEERILQILDQLTPKPFMPLYQVRRPKHEKRADAFHNLARLDIARQAKEVGAGAAVATTSLDHSYNAPHVPFELPDGQKVDIPAAMRFAVADLLLGRDDESTQRREEAVASHQKEFAALLAAASHSEDDGPDDVDTEKYSESAAVGLSTKRNNRTAEKQSKQKRSSEVSSFSNRHLQRACAPYLQNLSEQVTAAPIPAMVCDAAFRCDRDQQASLLGNVVLCGGGACIGPTDQAVPDVLREQVEAIIHTHTPGWRVKVLSPNIQERAICSWLGGSILASLGTFHDMWITKAEYEEWGSGIVNRKCP